MTGPLRITIIQEAEGAPATALIWCPAFVDQMQWDRRADAMAWVAERLRGADPFVAPEGE